MVIHLLLSWCIKQLCGWRREALRGLVRAHLAQASQSFPYSLRLCSIPTLRSPHSHWACFPSLFPPRSLQAFLPPLLPDPHSPWASSPRPVTHLPFKDLCSTAQSLRKQNRLLRCKPCGLIPEVATIFQMTTIQCSHLDKGSSFWNYSAWPYNKMSCYESLSQAPELQRSLKFKWKGGCGTW